MVKLNNFFITLLPLLFFSSITTVISRPTTINRRGVSENCDPIFGICYQWPSNNPFTSRPFLRSQTPPSSIVVPSPPPVFTNPSFSPLIGSPPLGFTNPSYSPLVASPPPPAVRADHYPYTSPPFLGLSFSPPGGGGNLPPEITLPPPADQNPQEIFLSPPQQNWPVDSQPVNVVIPPPVDENVRTGPQLPPVVQSPPAT